jgi:hypothetical protein
MSAEGAVHAALVAALRGAAEVGGVVNGVFEGPAVKASAPYAEVQVGQAIDWGTKDRVGRELRPAVALYDAGETPARLHELIGAVCAAIEAMPRDLDGWRVASLAFSRSRTLRTKPGEWAATVEYRVRVLAV